MAVFRKSPAPAPPAAPVAPKEKKPEKPQLRLNELVVKRPPYQLRVGMVEGRMSSFSLLVHMEFGERFLGYFTIPEKNFEADLLAIEGAIKLMPELLDKYRAAKKEGKCQ